ncbi:NAD(P)/FAD-dependent oxidoreductase [Candidatus Poribacteria bacterium]|nr:NAD(P)/FAD-dependent oxidoreductase [Candidatus Poribacteria bacterium]
MTLPANNPDIYDITIVGAGPVGLFGAFYAGIRECRTKIIDSLAELGGQLTALYPEKYIYDMPGFPKVLAKDLVKELVEQAMWKDPTVCLEEQAQKLDYDEATGIYRLVTNVAEHFSRTVIVCAGIGSLLPTRLDKPGVEELVGNGVSYVVRNPDQFAGKDVVIVGAGDSAVDWALYMAPIAKSLNLVHRRDVFRAHEGSVRQLMQTNIPMHLFWEVEKVHGTDRLESVTIRSNKTKETQTLKADALLINIGFKSDLGPIQDWGLEVDEKGGILVSRHMETNRPGVFAAGDGASFDGKLKLIATGVGEVAIAVNYAKFHIDPTSKVFPGHSSEMALR